MEARTRTRTRTRITFSDANVHRRPGANPFADVDFDPSAGGARRK